LSPASFFFFFIATAPTDIYTLSLHDALPILHRVSLERGEDHLLRRAGDAVPHRHPLKVATIQLGRAHRPRAVDGHRQPHPASAEAGIARSEERRVGKEGGSRWSRTQ